MIRASLFAAALLAATWSTSIRYQAWYAWPSTVLEPEDVRLCGVGCGGVIYQAYHRVSLEERVRGTAGWHFATVSVDIGLRAPQIETDEYRTLIWFPFWPLFTAAALPTALAMVWPRGRTAGLCRVCGYDLAGNASWRCPECGASM